MANAAALQDPSWVLGPSYNLYQFSDNLFKVVHFSNPLRRLKGIVEADRSKKGNEQKMDQSISRAKRVVLEKALCNDWDWFGTFTLNPDKYDRYNLDKFYKDFTQWIRDQRKKTGHKIKYILIPEGHKDGAWHMHGLLRDVPDTVSFRTLRRHGFFVPNTLFADSRAFRKFSKGRLEYFLEHRHRNADIALFTQQWDGVDRKIRTITDRVYYIKKGLLLGHWISSCYRIPYDIIIPDPKKAQGGEKLGEIIQGYCKPPILVRIFCKRIYRPKYYKYFDSWELDPFPDLPAAYAPVEQDPFTLPIARRWYISTRRFVKRSCRRIKKVNSWPRKIFVRLKTSLS